METHRTISLIVIWASAAIMQTSGLIRILTHIVVDCAASEVPLTQANAYAFRGGYTNSIIINMNNMQTEIHEKTGGRRGGWHVDGLSWHVCYHRHHSSSSSMPVFMMRQ